MDHVCDTHALVWYFTEDLRLSKRALEAFESTVNEGFIIVPALVLAEIMYIAKKGRIALNFEETLVMIEKNENFLIAPLQTDILRIANKMEEALEMHDRLIVATALYFEAALITKDEQIKKNSPVSVVW